MDNYENPIPGKTYISPGLSAFGDSKRRVRIISKVIAPNEAIAFGTIKDEIILRRTDGNSIHIKATFFEDDRSIDVLTIQGFTAATDKPRNTSFSFRPSEIDQLIEFIDNIRAIDLENRGAVNISDDDLRKLILSGNQARSLVRENEDLFAEIAKSEITKHDIIAVGYRKKQLKVFERLLSEDGYFDGAMAKLGVTPEALWQRFFEKNSWIFGHGLSYHYLSSLDDKKLEQVVTGSSVSGPGKRIDGLLKSRGIISSMCFVEIKTHKTDLLAKRPYRSGCWQPSQELSGAVSQVQGTVARAMDTIQGVLRINDEQGFPTGEQIFNYAPQAFLVVGHLSEFVGERGVNLDQYRSLELFRRNTHSPEILTFDELFERAKFIVGGEDNKTSDINS